MFNRLNTHQAGQAEKVAEFRICLKSLHVGTLSYTSNGIWIFQYTEAFKSQEQYSPIFGFFDLDETYQSRVLWTFFDQRIPSAVQTRVQSWMEENPQKKDDKVALLSKFGKRTITNPYILEPA